VGSPAVAVDSDPTMTASMRRMIKMMNRDDMPDMPGSKPDLEINPDHAMMVRLNAIRESDAALAGEVSAQIFDNALVSAGLLEDPRAMLSRLNSLLERLLSK
jgi:molecular chaperone HtpG